MKIEQFETLVRLEIPAAQNDLVKAIVQKYDKDDRIDREYVGECVQEIKQITRLVPEWPERLTTVRPREFPSLILESEQALSAIQPWVENVREALFEARGIPFKSYKQAVEWLTTTTETQPRPTAEERSRAEELRREIVQKGQELANLLKGAFKFDTPLTLLPYPSLAITNDTRCIERVPVLRGSSLAILHSETARMEKATGFQQAALVEHVLTGAAVVFPPSRLSITPHSYKLPGSETIWLHRTEASLHFPSPQHLDSRYLQSLFRSLRERLGLKRKKRPTDKNQRLFALIKKVGRVPKTNKTAYWEQIKNEWNKRYPKEKYTTWRGLEMAHRRTGSRLAR